MRSNHEYDYLGNVLEYEYDYFPSYSSTSTQKVLVLEYEYTSTITPSLEITTIHTMVCVQHYCQTRSQRTTTFWLYLKFVEISAHKRHSSF